MCSIYIYVSWDPYKSIRQHVQWEKEDNEKMKSYSFLLCVLFLTDCWNIKVDTCITNLQVLYWLFFKKRYLNQATQPDIQKYRGIKMSDYIYLCCFYFTDTICFYSSEEIFTMVDCCVHQQTPICWLHILFSVSVLLYVLWAFALGCCLNDVYHTDQYQFY